MGQVFWRSLFWWSYFTPVNDLSRDKIQHILKSKIEFAINNLKDSKSLDLYNTYSEYINAEEPLLNALSNLFNCILTTAAKAP